MALGTNTSVVARAHPIICRVLTRIPRISSAVSPSDPSLSVPLTIFPLSLILTAIRPRQHAFSMLLVVFVLPGFGTQREVLQCATGQCTTKYVHARRHEPYISCAVWHQFFSASVLLAIIRCFADVSGLRGCEVEKPDDQQCLQTSSHLSA